MHLTKANVPRTEVLLITAVSVFSLVFGLFEYREYHASNLLLNQFDSNTAHTVSGLRLLTAMRKGSDYVQVVTLKSVLSGNRSTNDDASRQITEEVLRNDSNLYEFSRLQLDTEEKATFDSLVAAREHNRILRDQIIGSTHNIYERGFAVLLDSQNKAYEKFQQLNGSLADKLQQNISIRNAQLTDRITQSNKDKAAGGVIFLTSMLGLLLLSMGAARKVKKLNQSLAKRERQYRELIENTDELITRCNEKGEIVFANDIFCETLQYPDYKGLFIPQILAEESLSDYDPQPSLQEYGRKLMNQTRVYKSRTGEKVYVEGNIVLDYDGEQFSGASAFFRNVTEKVTLYHVLEASEKKYKELFNLSPLPQYFIEPETWKILEVNQAAIEHYGYSQEEFREMSVFDLRRAGFTMTERTGLNEMFHKKFSRFSTNITQYKKNGEAIDVELDCSALEFGANQGLLVMVRDVTEKKRLMREVNRAFIKAQEDERHAIGSELHDNVCQIIASSQLMLGLLKDSVTEQALPWWQNAKRYIDQALTEIRNISHQLAPVFLEDTTLNEAMERLLNSVSAGAGFTTKLNFDSSAEQHEITPELQLHLYRILQEQLRNIVQYAAATQVAVSLFVTDLHLHFEIKDNGRGFNPEHVKKGIGLRNIARRAKIFTGRMKVNSLPDKGCVISVEIPVEVLQSGPDDL